MQGPNYKVNTHLLAQAQITDQLSKKISCALQNSPSFDEARGRKGAGRGGKKCCNKQES